METILFIIAAVLVIAGIVSLVRGQILWGIVLIVIGFKVFEWITPRLDVERELAEKNIAVGLVCAAVVLGVAILAAVAVK